MLRQRTIREKASCTGVGLHSGRPIKLEILPADQDSGITFTRTDVGPHAEVRASIDHVVDTTLATTLGAGLNGSRITIGTVEHLLAAFTGLGIDNAQVLVDGPEIPVLDGSSQHFIEMLMGAGLEEQAAGKRFVVITREVKVEDGDKWARIAPGNGLKITCSIDFDHPLMPPTPFTFDFSERAFQKELAGARTFGFLKDVEALQSAGLALGGSLDNAIVIDHYRVLNPEGLRYPDEFVRHKLLDAIGDLSLFGMPVVGRVKMHKSGHAMNTALIRQVLADEKAYEIVQPEAAEIDAALAGEETPLAMFAPVESLA